MQKTPHCEGITLRVFWFVTPWHLIGRYQHFIFSFVPWRWRQHIPPRS